MAGTLPHEKPYEYSDLHRDEIRLLQLNPLKLGQTIEAPLRATLSTFTLTPENDDHSDEDAEADVESASPHKAPDPPKQLYKEAPEYDALSYTWGGENLVPTHGRDFETLLIEIKPATELHRYAAYRSFLITPNLAAALKRFRQNLQEGDELHLWVDAVCINQAKESEKSEQIRKMSTIYSEARIVRVWLGESDTNTDAAFNFIDRMLSFEKFDDMVKDPTQTSGWDALKSLMQRSWFSRRWIVQEIAFAKNATVHCGDSEVPWDALKGAILLFADIAEKLRETFAKKSEHGNNPGYLGEVQAWGAITLAEATDTMFRKSGQHNIIEHAQTLESLVTALTPFDAKLPHDCIYAIVRLSKDAKPSSRMTSDDGARPQRQRRPPNRELRRTDTERGGSRAAGISDVNGVTDGTTDAASRRAENKQPEETEEFRSTEIEGQPADAADIGSQNGDLLNDGISVVRGRPKTRPTDESMSSSTLLMPGTAARDRSKSPMRARKDAERPFLKVKPATLFDMDYRRSMLSLCTAVIEHAADRSGSIDIICKPWVPPIKCEDEVGKPIEVHEHDRKTMPSWLRSLNERPFSVDGRSNNKRFSRVAADPLVGASLLGQKTYKASGDIPYERRDRCLIKGRTLNAYGFVLGQVGEKTDIAMDAVIPGEWLEFGGWTETINPPPPEFWRTLVADREKSDDPRRPPEYWPWACRWVFQQRPKSGEVRNLNTNDLIMKISATPSTHVMSFLHRLRAVVWNRRLIKTKENHEEDQILGLAPRKAKKDDLICILYGCSVPVLLREKKPQPKPVRPAGIPRRLASGRGTPRGRAEGRRGSTPRVSRGPSPVSQPMPGIFSDDGGFTQEPGHYDVESELPTGDGFSKVVSDPSSKVYSLIGECFLYGMMDGEAFLEKEQNKVEEQFFAIGCTQDCDCLGCQKSIAS